jgi:peptidoglycan/LPS O-acetylase OafA/YrhL
LSNSTSTQSDSVIEYKPQLDGLRFLAVFFVLFYHYNDWIRTLKIPFTVDMGTFISFFFVLSSYLITTILLTKKRKDPSRRNVALNFLSRRTLRIFPAYYFYLLLLLLLPYAGWDVRDHAPMYFGYMSNFQTYTEQSWNNLTSHLWTLAVEEQFYIVWLWVILFIPDRHLLKVFAAIIVSGIAFRLLYFVLHKQAATEVVPYVILTPANVDAFAFGAILAYLHRVRKTVSPLLKKIFLAVLPIWIALILLHGRIILLGFDRIFAAIGSMIIIEGAGKRYRNVFGRFLENKVVVYLGKISYGIYLYHLLVPFLFWRAYNPLSYYLLHKRGIDLGPLTEFLVNPVVSFCLYFGITVLFSAASWHLLERPVNRLKRYFIYSSTPKKQAPATY